MSSGILGRLRNAHAWVPSVVRLGAGLGVRSEPRHPPQRLLELYDYEACPYCRKVREALSELDLEYLSIPCAKGSSNRAFVVARGGMTQFPYFVDPNTAREMYESEDIVTYLWETYGPGRGRASKIFAPLNTFGASLASTVRPRGMQVRPSSVDRAQPAARLELWSFEASPYCRKVREVLCELNLVTIVHNVAKKSARRPELVALGGKMQVPYLADPNTGTAMYESDDIIAYLERTYG
jgi:glutathione S-transferase